MRQPPTTLLKEAGSSSLRMNDQELVNERNMSEIENDRLVNRFNGFLFIVIGLLLFVCGLFSDNKLGFGLGLFFGAVISVLGLWLTKTKKVYWSPASGFTPK